MIHGHYGDDHQFHDVSERGWARMMRRHQGIPELLPDAFWNRFLQSLIERPELRDALRAAMREQEAGR
ncbi:MAG: hypothetical protein FD138_4690 [Planctomycetota bacterium]|nr:MAG: hypothetical protein FD138_4690 [Planctomycetota bacterium]